MEPKDTQKSALDVAREARKKHESVEGSYRDQLHLAIADIARSVQLFDCDVPGYESLLKEEFFVETQKNTGRKRDTSNKFNTLARYILDANTREKEQTVNVYANVARYYCDNGISPDEIAGRIHEDGGIKEIAKLATKANALKAAIFEDEIWGDLVALKIWVNQKHLDRAMKIEKGQQANLKIQRVDGTSDYKEFACKKFKRIRLESE
ncbi:hypothetical protein [Methylobacterium sp. J-070]|uniref:hypothetical protein n=1 Tax=Methylobacterium sp. J-070 TaxID=2836650 RepID=UPI001FB8B915|nr:hypothetical protein [Methylobacterium sp. J-070]MCJ2051648.1 hypothetical protein [Methylobacterium sp. J-070]